ncbi:MAG: CRISPR-associated protein Csm3 [Merismopedia sp. SIO2A8]|nr:CRISPR-associated protein Csm3 [Symploca sp. SIO2B6]NET51109.1 CRISPR-associated protein Csm3 [Merismopedia sp. SIO2A8]
MISLGTLNQTLAEQQQSDQIELTAIVDTTLCVGAGGSSGSLADKPIIKTADGRLIIPASQLKGRLRHECEKITRALGWPICHSPVAQSMCPEREGISDKEEADFQQMAQQGQYQVSGFRGEHCLVCQLFGNPTLPANLHFSDLVCSEAAETIPEVLRPGVTINRRRQTAEEQKLYFLETSPANAKLKFEGTITLLPGTPDYARLLIFIGLKHIHALGGSKSTGLGWLHWESPLFSDSHLLDVGSLDKSKVGGAS